MEWNPRKIDMMQFHKVRISCTNGETYSGTADCVCDASDGSGDEIDGILFWGDNGYNNIFTEDEIESFEILD